MPPSPSISLRGGRAGRRSRKPTLRVETLEGRRLLSGPSTAGPTLPGLVGPLAPAAEADGGLLIYRDGFELLEFPGIPFGQDQASMFGHERLALFYGHDADDTATDYTATIDWGDGTTSRGTVAPHYSQPLAVGPDGEAIAGPTLFDVKGGHTYAEPGAYTIRITIRDREGHSAVATSKADVPAGPLVLIPRSGTSHAYAGRPDEISPPISFPDRIELGQLYDARGLGSFEDYTVIVDWGDGTTSAGVLDHQAFIPEEPPSHPSYAVGGDHRYAAPGLYTVTFTVTDKEGHAVTATARVQVDQYRAAPPVPAPPSSKPQAPPVPGPEPTPPVVTADPPSVPAGSIGFTPTSAARPGRTFAMFAGLSRSRGRQNGSSASPRLGFGSRGQIAFALTTRPMPISAFVEARGAFRPGRFGRG